MKRDCNCHVHDTVLVVMMFLVLCVVVLIFKEQLIEAIAGFYDRFVQG